MLSLLFLSITSVLAQIPRSPYGDTAKICNNVNGRAYSVDGFPGTPYVITPFKETFRNPDILPPKTKVCRSDAHCMFSYEIDMVDVQLKPFDNVVEECRKKPGSWFITYNGVIPGPTIQIPSGHESLLRFNNKIGNHFKTDYKPCNTANRKGRPISVHLHGSASLAPYDGWAEDNTCNMETKDYVYPNNRPVTAWYHDHALHITAYNAYLGLSGMYIITNKKKFGGCGEPWNLEDIEELNLIISDRVLTSNCDSFIDTKGVHKDDLYGDINVVSGIAFPNMPIDAKWYRFRILNAAVSRPYLLKIKNERNVDVSKDICWVIASDGGYRSSPVRFPAQGLLIGVAERYEVVCDFRRLRNQVLYLWNEFNKDMMKDVPYFCYSHLVAKIIVSNRVITTPAFQPNLQINTVVNYLTRVLSQQDISEAQRMISQGRHHREFKFGRSGGQWTINGETWDTMKIAASDVGHNTWELWLFETGGGWFHPVHIHLVDFFVLKRDGKGGLRDYERMVPKDVFYLGPSNKVWVIARFGAHKGDYMFHCHNLIHEDDDMMRAMRVMDGGPNVRTAQQFLINPLHKIIYNNWKYSDPMLGETSAQPTKNVPQHTLEFVTNTLNKNLYRIFYPLPEDKKSYSGFENPWEANWCPI